MQILFHACLNSTPERVDIQLADGDNVPAVAGDVGVGCGEVLDVSVESAVSESDSDRCDEDSTSLFIAVADNDCNNDIEAQLYA